MASFRPIRVKTGQAACFAALCPEVLILAFAVAVTCLLMVREGLPSTFFGALEQIKTWMVRLRAP